MFISLLVGNTSTEAKINPFCARILVSLSLVKDPWSTLKFGLHSPNHVELIRKRWFAMFGVPVIASDWEWYNDTHHWNEWINLSRFIKTLETSQNKFDINRRKKVTKRPYPRRFCKVPGFQLLNYLGSYVRKKPNERIQKPLNLTQSRLLRCSEESLPL